MIFLNLIELIKWMLLNSMKYARFSLRKISRRHRHHPLLCVRVASAHPQSRHTRFIYRHNQQAQRCFSVAFKVHRCWFQFPSDQIPPHELLCLAPFSFVYGGDLKLSRFGVTGVRRPWLAIFHQIWVVMSLADL